MKRRHRWNKTNAFGWFRYAQTLKEEEAKPPDYRFDPEQQRFLSDDGQTAIADASIFGQVSDNPYPQADLSTDKNGNPSIKLKNDEPYVFQKFDEWEAVLQYWEFNQNADETDEPL